MSFRSVMVGLTAGDAFPGDPNLQCPAARPQCVVSWYGLGDLTLGIETHPRGRRALRSIVGRSYREAPELYRELSPIYHLERGAAPLLLMTGAEDSVVLPEQSETLVEKARARGVKAECLLVANAQHGWRSAGGPLSPGLAEIQRRTAEFIRVHTGVRRD